MLHIQLDEKNTDLFYNETGRRIPWTVDKKGWVFYNDWVNGASKRVLLHRLVASRKVGRPLTYRDRIIHVNADKQDNREDNLLISDYSQQGQRSKKREGSTSRYNGVYYWRERELWRARVVYRKGHRRMQASAGTHKTEEAAALAYNRVVVKYYPHPKLNVIE